MSGQNLNMGHFSHPTARATGQSVMRFTPFHYALRNWAGNAKVSQGGSECKFTVPSGPTRRRRE